MQLQHQIVTLDRILSQLKLKYSLIWMFFLILLSYFFTSRLEDL